MSDTPLPESKVLQIDYVEYWVGNAKLCAKFYCSAFGFYPLAIKGLETGEKQTSSHVLVQGNATFVFTSTLRSNHTEFNQHLGVHGDAIKDVALRVENVYSTFQHAIKNGAKVVEEPHVLRDELGTVVVAKIAAPYGDVVHTLIDRSKYNGVFLPGFKSVDAIPSPTPGFGVTHIDHIALAYEKGKTLEVMNWYSNCLGFVQFLCNDEDTNEGLTVVGSEGGLKTIVIASSLQQYSLKFVLVEALDHQEGKKQNQIQEFIEFNGGKSGVHHIALHTNDIVTSVKLMKDRGVDFITVPSLYYDDLFAKEGSFMKESQEKLQELGILMDISFKKASPVKSPNFLFQTFTVPLQDRPTFFFEIISRKGSSGFGDRTIKALFEAIERLQDKRTVS